MIIRFKLGENARMPEQANITDAGYDVFFAGNDRVLLADGCRYKFDTNLSWEPVFDDEEEKELFAMLHMGVYMDVRDRSGTSYKKGLLKMAGVIDEAYRGNIGIVLLNASQEVVTIEPGDKIAQIIFSPCFHPTAFHKVDDVNVTARGSGGFGSTGK